MQRERELDSTMSAEIGEDAARELLSKARAAKQASRAIARASSSLKDEALKRMARNLKELEPRILQANAADVERAKRKGVSAAFIDRLSLNPKRIEEMIQGLMDLARLPDPVGQVVSMWKRPNGLRVGRMRVPIGVVGLIYEARPNVTVDAAALCLKAGNASVLRGSSETIESNKALVSAISEAVASVGLPGEAVVLIESPGHEVTRALMRLRGYVDVLIPRGGGGLIASVVENATIPVIETGVGNCHVYIDESADLDMAERIVINAKTQRPAVCNAIESLLIHRSVAEHFVPRIVKQLESRGVEIRGCREVLRLAPHVKPAVEDDWYEEYLDLILAVKVVDGIDEAIEHIEKYGSHHSDAIITRDYARAKYFLEAVDSAAVYVNASTRFTDGFQFGMGAEIGISTQKLHARGPMGLEELTTTKFVVVGDGQIRE